MLILCSTPVPALPGAQNTEETDGEAENFHAERGERGWACA